jgi:glycosyltransferase involved in cell wall biosynthesis
MKILHVIDCYPPTRAFTGPPAVVHRLCRELARQGVDVRVVTTNSDGSRKLEVPTNRWTEYEGVPVYYGNRWGWNGQLSPAMRRRIWRDTREADLVHVTFIYSWTLLSAGGACRRHGVPLVISPRGSFAPEAQAWRAWKKRLFMALGGSRTLAMASAFHATTAEEEEHIRALYPGTRVGRVPNGVEFPDDEQLAEWKRGATEDLVLFLGRFHPHKNIDLLIRAWARIADRLPKAFLVLAGPDFEGFETDLRALAQNLGLGKRVRFVGRKDGEDKSVLLARARVLILPSKSENFGNVVVEALAHGTPVITSRGTPWSEAVARGCGWWVEAREDALAAALEGALRAGPQRLSAMGAVGRLWMREAFSWPAVANGMRSFYDTVVGGLGAGPRSGTP